MRGECKKGGMRLDALRYFYPSFIRPLFNRVIQLQWLVMVKSPLRQDSGLDKGSYNPYLLSKSK